MKSIRKPSLALAVLVSASLSPLHAEVVAVDDGSGGAPFLTTRADTPALGGDVTANDTGASLTVVAGTVATANGGTVDLRSDGTFFFTPGGAAVRALDSGSSLTDTFSYSLTVPLAGGLNQELNANTGTDSFGWGGEGTAVAATGTALPVGITSAYEFDGTGGATRGSFDSVSQQSVSFDFWLRPDVVNSNQTIFETGGTGDGSGLYINGDGTVSYVVKNGANNAIVQSAAPLTAGTWYHIATTYERGAGTADDTVTLYINGASVATVTVTDVNDWSGSDGAGLGRKNGTSAGEVVNTDGDGSNETYGNFDGQIAIVRYYGNKVLTATEVFDNYCNATAVDTATVTVQVDGINDTPSAIDDVVAGSILADSSLVSTADLTANDGSTRAAPPANRDSLILNYDANQATGSTTWPNTGPYGGTALDWKLGSGVTLNTSVVTAVPTIRQAYTFDGTANARGVYGTFPPPGPNQNNDAIHDLLNSPVVPFSRMDQSSATFEFWAKPANTSQVMTLFETGGGSGFGMIINNGVLEAATELDGKTQDGSYVSYDLVADPLGLVKGGPTADFNHYAAAMRVNGGGISLYVNGVLVDNTTTGTAADWDGGDGSGLGRWGGDNHGGFDNGASGTIYNAPFLGEIASFRLYVGDIGADQVKRNYDAATNLVRLEWDARNAGATNDLWPNTGRFGGTELDWNLGSGITLNSSVSSARAQISAAYEFDGTVNAAGVFTSILNGESFDTLIGASLDQEDATFEAWVKLGAADLTQVSTIFETGGTTGFGVVVDNGVLTAATGADGGPGTGSTVSYDLVADTLGVLGGSATTAEFFQVAVAIEVGGGLRLYVNGTEVDVSTSAATDWSGADGTGLGRWADGSHGGFAADPVASGYDNSFNGSIALLRFYGAALEGGDILQNFTAVASDTDVEGNAFTVTGIYDEPTGTWKAVTETATLDSGATVTLDSATGAFTYDPNGAFAGLVAGETGVDTFSYQITSATGTGTAQVHINVSGQNVAANDTIEATETLVTNFTANQLVGNDQHATGTSDAYLNFDGNSVTAADILATRWRNTGSGGSGFDANMAGGTLITPPLLESNFGAIGQSWQNPAGTFASFTAISGQDATIEIWFQPTPLTSGRQLLMESGGGGNGMSIVYNADTAEVDFIIDGGDDNNDNIQVSATGIVPGEFNQLIAVYDKDSPTVEDTLTLYLNGDPAAFSGVADATKTNAGGTTNNFSGGDGSGIGTVNGSEALVGSFGNPGFPATASVPFQGQISIVRVYPRKLSATEFEDNYDAILQKIETLTGTGAPGTTITTTLGATVTLNADRSFDYDATALTADIPEGNVQVDTFDYTISDGAGGTTTATVTVNVTGVGSFLAIDDNFGVNESDGATAFNPVANDSGADAVVVELQSTVSNLATSIPTGTVNGESADFLDGSGHGWQFLWNAPTGWTPGGSFDGTTGALGSTADYQQLVWDDTVGGWLVDADGTDSNADAEPGAYLRISPDGSGINGLGSTQDGAVGNTQERCLILAYTVDSDGYYWIDDSTITVASGASNGVTIETLVDATPSGSGKLIAGGATDTFDKNIGFASANQTIYVAICPNGNRASDFFSGLDFTLLKLPSAESLPDDILGTVSTDGSLITYDPAGAFEGLAAGQTVDETITYTIRDLSSTLDYDGGTVAFTPGQVVTASSGGTATIISVNGDATSGTLRLGVITGTIADNDTLSGGGGGSALANGAPVASTSVSTADFTVTVTGENDAPTAVADPLAATADEDAGVTGALSVLLNDTDPDQGDALSLVVSEVQGTPVSGATVVATDKGGSLTMNPDGTFDYVPLAGLFEALAVGETDTDTFTYLCADSGGLPAGATALATITINGNNDPVTATANAYAVDVDSLAAGNLITDDTGSGVDSTVDTNDTLSVSGVDTSATLGSVTVASDGSFTYDPGCAFDGLAPGANGVDTFVYTLSDGQGATDTATVTITATGVNRAAGVEDPATLAQVVTGSGTLALGDIVVTDPDSNRSLVTTAATALFEFRNGVSVFSDARPDGNHLFDIDAGGPALIDGDGMSIDLTFVPQAADLTGSRVLFDIGGSSNGTSIILVDGIPHLLSKATSSAGLQPTDDNGADNVFRDLDWAGDSTVVVPLATEQVTPGESTKIAVVYDIANDSVIYSMNNVPAQTATLLNNDSVDYNGDHSVSIGVDGGGIGGETNTGSGPFRDNGFLDLTGGSAAVSCMRFWSEATGSVGVDLGETVTATLTIQSWNGTDTLSGLSNDGGGVFSVSGDAATVNAALAAMEFVPAGTTTYPVTIDVSIDDGNEDGSGAVTGAIYINDAAPSVVYVDDGFSGSFLDPIADADGGAPVAPATFGVDAFATIAEAVAAVDPSGTIIVNDGDYSAEGIGLTISAPNVTLQLTGSGGSAGGSTVTIGSLNASPTNSVAIGQEALVLGNATSTNQIDCPITGTTGTLTKVGADTLQIRAACTFTGVTTVSEGTLEITYIDAVNRGSLASTGITVTSPGVLQLAAAVDTTYIHSNVISGTGSVSTTDDGTVEFNTPGGNSFSGGFDLGGVGSSTFDGASGTKAGFVVLNDSSDLGTGKILSRGGQLQAGTTGIVIPNDIDITGGGFRNGGSNDFSFSGAIATIDNSLRGFGNYGLDGLDLTITGPVDNSGGNIQVEGSNGKDNGSWTITGNITGPSGFVVQSSFDDGEVTLGGTNSYTGVTEVQTGTLVLDATHSGGDAYTVQSGATLAGGGSTTSAVTVNAGGTLSPGGTGIADLQTGALNVAGTLVIDVDNTAGAAGTAYDQVVVTTGTVDVGGSLTVNDGPGPEANPADITIIANNDVNPVGATFSAGVPFSTDYLGSNRVGYVAYDGGDGNDVVLIDYSQIEAWRFDNGLALNGDDDGGDLDLDNLANLLEFGFGTDAGVSDNAVLNPDGSVNGTPITVASGSGAGVTFDALFIRRDDFGQSGSVSYTVEFSGDLVTFFPSGAPVTIVADSTDDPAYHVASIPHPGLLPNGQKARFFRVVVTVVP